MNDLQSLIRLAKQGDSAAKDILVAQNAALVWSVARRFTGRGVELDDLFQLGCLGFLKAVDGFDPEFGTQFSTYAVPKIAGEIRRFLRDDGSLKVSRTVKEQATQIRIMHSHLSNALSREPTLKELSAHTGLSVEEIAMARSATAATQSIDAEAGEDGFCLQDILCDPASEDRLLEHIALKQAICRLSEREQNVIRLRYYHCLTQERTAKVLGVSQVQVSRIEKKALQSLKAMLV